MCEGLSFPISSPAFILFVHCSQPRVVKYNLIVALICTSLMNNDVDYLVMYCLAICTSSLEKHLFKSFAHLKNQVVSQYMPGIPVIWEVEARRLKV